MSEQAQAPATNAGEPHVKTMTYQDLRRMAECAASYRDGEVWIVFDEKGWRVATTEPKHRPGQQVIPCNNAGKGPGKEPPKVSAAFIQANESGQPVDLLHLKRTNKKTGKVEDLGPADAVFWSAAAVEKFVVPYYASVYADEAPGKLEKIIRVLGTVHKPSGSSTGGETAEPFALAHMPKSEYVQVEGAFAVLAKTSSGEHVAIPITEYLNPQPRKEEGETA